MIIDRVLQWAEKEDAIRAIIIQGSRATKNYDELSDYDLSLFCRTYDSYLHSDAWLSSFGNVWVCIHEKFYQNHTTIPTRLVIFEDGVKIDFAFFTLEALHTLKSSPHLPADYNRGYEVLIDKDAATVSMPRPMYKEGAAEKPSKNEFLRIVKEFWFEIYHVAKYLKRNDLWPAKFRVGQFLLQMIKWYEEAKRDWQIELPPEGKRMQSWVEPTTWDALHHIFAHFDAEDSWKALPHITALFRRLALNTASKLGIEYPHDVDRNITNWVTSLLHQ